jgi:pyruvate dehydrogenase E1 component
MRGRPGFDPATNAVNLIASGAMIPDACEASNALIEEGVYASVINVTGPGPLYRHYREYARNSIDKGESLSEKVSELIPGAISGAPVVTLADAHPHSLAWVGSALGSRAIPLGVDEWGQSGGREDLYREYGTDSDTVMAACFAALDT